MKKLSAQGRGIRAGVGAWMEAGRRTGAGLGLSTSYGSVDEEILETPARSSAREHQGCETMLLVEDDRAVQGAL